MKHLEEKINFYCCKYISTISVDYGIVSCFTAGCWVRGIDSTTHTESPSELVLLFSSILIPHFQPVCCVYFSTNIQS